MCGIAGVVSCDQNMTSSDSVVGRMLQAMAHRGPDNEAIRRYPQAVIGNRRLNIIDPHPHANQPMESQSKRFSITFNGEIYNYKELRSELTKKCQFRTHSDTEVLLNVMKHSGVDGLPRLNGIFAFGLWDSKERRLLLARDPIGVKPLYWWRNEDTLIFCSELKGILASGLVPRTIEPEALHHLLSVQAVPPPLTMFHGVHMLLPGSYLLWQNGHVTVQRYFEFSFEEDDSLGGDMAPYREKTYDLVNKAIIRQRQADVPATVALSGGIDSSIIATVLQAAMPENISTTTMSHIEENGDRTGDQYHARIVANTLRTQHSVVTLTSQDVVRALPRAILAQDQPSVRSLIAYLLFERIPRNTRVVFYGTGGDELFAGYGTMELLRSIEAQRQFGPFPLLSGRYLFQAFPSLYRFFPSAESTFRLLAAESIYRKRQLVDWIFLDDEKKQFYSKSFLQQCDGFHSDEYFQSFAGNGHDKPSKVHQQLDWLGIVCEHTTQLDAVSMAHGLEARVPLLDPELVQFAAHLPAFALAPSDQDHKYLLREAFRSHLPSTIVSRQKRGFDISLERHYAPILSRLCSTFLSPKNIRARGIFSPEAIGRLVNDYVAHPHAVHKGFEKLFMLLCVEIWLQLFLDNKTPEDIVQSSECFLFPSTPKVAHA